MFIRGKPWLVRSSTLGAIALFAAGCVTGWTAFVLIMAWRGLKLVKG